MAAHVDKVLKGGQPGQLRVETVTRYELIVNLSTAREIGVTIPPEVLKRADQSDTVTQFPDAWSWNTTRGPLAGRWHVGGILRVPRLPCPGNSDDVG